MQDVRIDRGVQALALRLGITHDKPHDTFALLGAISEHCCGCALAVDVSLSQNEHSNGGTRRKKVKRCCACL